MFEFTETVEICATPQEVWTQLYDLERWWIPSNPEHISLEVRPVGKKIEVGTKIAFEESVAGIKARAAGTVTTLVPEVEARWEGIAEYRYLGLPLRVREGVVWRISSGKERSRLSAQVWAEFPRGLWGRAIEWYSNIVLKVVERDQEHARRELQFLKRLIETTR